VYDAAMLLLLACSPDPSPPLDLSAALGPDDVRAGIVLETDALFDGIAAEGRLGDIKIYNDRARFIIQQPGDSSYYVEYGGMLIDADIVRAAGAPGRDAIDELGPMIGLGRIVNAESVTVMDDGQDGEAWVRVSGPAQPLQIMTGSLENPDLVPALDLWVCTDYRLKAGSPLLDVTTTVKNREATDQDLFIGDIGFLSMEAVERYRPRTGLDNDGEPVPWEGAMGRADEVALALLSQEGDLDQGMAGSLLSALGPVISGFGPTTTVAAGESLSFHRYIGVAPDLATLSAEQQRLQGQSLKTLSGHVQSEAGPVAGTQSRAQKTAGSRCSSRLGQRTGNQLRGCLDRPARRLRRLRLRFLHIHMQLWLLISKHRLHWQCIIPATIESPGFRFYTKSLIKK